MGQRLSRYSLSASEHNLAFQSDCKLLIVKGTWHCALIRHKVENPETVVVNSLVKAIGITGTRIMGNVDVCWRVEQREGCLSNHNPEALKEEPVFPSKTTWDSFSPTQISLWQTHKTTDACYAELQLHFKKCRCYQRPNSAPVERAEIPPDTTAQNFRRKAELLIPHSLTQPGIPYKTDRTT